MFLQTRRGEHVLVMLDAGAGEGHDKNRVPRQGVGVYSLPFGWTHGPLMATELLRTTLQKFHMPGIRPIQFVADVLVYGYDKTEVGAAGLQLRELLERDGWICSPKSQLEPTNTIEWMGKSLDGRHWTIQSSAPYTAGMVALWLKLATMGCSQKDMRRMEKLAWADRPARQIGPHTGGALAWMMCGPHRRRYCGHWRKRWRP